MRARDAVGRRIVAVDQRRFYNEHIQRFEHELLRIELDNGSVITFFATETEAEPIVLGTLTKWKDRG